MSSPLQNKRIFYSYWDVNGDGLNPAHITTYSDSVIFDSYNRTLYSYGSAFGNHQLGTYHGEVFNDFDNNHAYGDYSSASGSNVTAYNAYEYGVGHYNKSVEGKTILTVGNGTAATPYNAVEVHNDNSTYVNGTFYANASYVANTSYTKTSYVTDNSYVKNNSYVAGHDVRKALEHMIRVLPVQTEGFHNGVYYVWMGTDAELPDPEDRYRNVIYIVCDESPSEELPLYNPGD